MSGQLYSVLGQTEGSRKAISEWTNRDFSSKLCLTCANNVYYWKSFHYLIPTLPVAIRNTLAIFIANLWVFISVECPGMFTSWPNWRGEEGLFWGCRKGAALWDYHQEHLVVIRDEKEISFCEIWNNPTPSLFLMRSPTNKHCRARNFLINLWIIDSRTCQKYRMLLSVR